MQHAFFAPITLLAKVRNKAAARFAFFRPVRLYTSVARKRGFTAGTRFRRVQNFPWRAHHVICISAHGILKDPFLSARGALSKLRRGCWLKVVAVCRWQHFGKVARSAVLLNFAVRLQFPAVALAFLPVGCVSEASTLARSLRQAFTLGEPSY